MEAEGRGGGGGKGRRWREGEEMEGRGGGGGKGRDRCTFLISEQVLHHHVRHVLTKGIPLFFAQQRVRRQVISRQNVLLHVHVHVHAYQCTEMLHREWDQCAHYYRANAPVFVQAMYSVERQLIVANCAIFKSNSLECEVGREEGEGRGGGEGGRVSV